MLKKWPLALSNKVFGKSKKHQPFVKIFQGEKCCDNAFFVIQKNGLYNAVQYYFKFWREKENIRIILLW